MEENIKPVGLKGNEVTNRIKELMSLNSVNESVSSRYVPELSKMGPDGNVYAIVRENHEYYIKTTNKKENLIVEDFNYIGGLKNKKSEAYPTYAKAIKHLNLKFNSIADALGKVNTINVFEDDGLVNESGVAGFSDMTGNGFSGEGNLNGDKPMKIDGDSEDEDELTEAEKAVDDMTKCEIEEKPIKESRKLSIVRAIADMDNIIESLNESKVKKKVYTLK